MRSAERIGSRFRSWRKPYHLNRDFNRRRPIHWRQRGNLRRSGVWRRKDEIISIFVDNINQRTIAETIRSFFEKFGEVCDVFISRKKRANNPNAFGFVKMKGPRNAYRAIKQMTGRWIDNSRLFVKEARFSLLDTKIGDRNGQISVNNSRKGMASSVDKSTSRQLTATQDSLEPRRENNKSAAQSKYYGRTGKKLDWRK